MSQVRCRSCGAGNAAGAQWCGQCLTRFDAGTPLEPEPPAPERAPLQSVPPSGVHRSEGGVAWRCPACGEDNPIDQPLCSVCATPMSALFTEPKPALRRTGATAMWLSMLMPGAGHAWAGKGGDAFARIILWIWTAGIGVLLVTRSKAKAAGVFKSVGMVFLAGAVAVWTLSLLESQRLARGEARPLIPSKVLLYGTVGLTAVLFIGLAAGAQTR